MQKVNFLLVKLSVICKITNGVQNRLLVISQWNLEALNRVATDNKLFLYLDLFKVNFPVPQYPPQEKKKVLLIIMVAGICRTS